MADSLEEARGRVLPRYWREIGNFLVFAADETSDPVLVREAARTLAIWLLVEMIVEAEATR